MSLTLCTVNSSLKADGVTLNNIQIHTYFFEGQGPKI